MADMNELPPESRELEQALATLPLRRPSLDRDQIMYHAGRRAALACVRCGDPLSAPPGPAWLWPILAAVSTSAAVMLAAALWLNGSPSATATPRMALPAESAAPQPDAPQADLAETDPSAEPAPAVALPLAAADTSAGAAQKGGRFNGQDATHSYFYLQRMALDHGVEALPSPSPIGGRPAGETALLTVRLDRQTDRFGGGDKLEQLLHYLTGYDRGGSL